MSNDHRTLFNPQRIVFVMLCAAAAVLATGHSDAGAQSASAHTLPFVPPASNVEQQGFVRIINNSNRPGDVTITAIDDRGRRFGPVILSLEARAGAHFNSQDLENGNSEKGLSGRAGNGYGNWRLELSTDLEIEHLAYIRTSDGFVTNMHEVAAETPEGSNRYHVPFFNPGKNRNQESKLRLINPESSSARIEITGVDDDGRATSPGAVSLDLGAGMARILTAYQLENGGSDLSGGLGAGKGKWRLSVSADRPIQVMSLLELPTGHLTNLSRGQDGVAVPPPPPPTNEPDLVVESPSVSDSSLNTGQSFTFEATVRNQGGGRSAVTTLRYYRSSDMTISMSDTGVGTDAVGGLSASDTSAESIVLTAPSSAGTYYYGACVDTVAGESDTGNNCSAAVRVTVSRGVTSDRFTAYATGWSGLPCTSGLIVFTLEDAPSHAEAEFAALAFCRREGGRFCEFKVAFADCGAVAVGGTARAFACDTYGGAGATISTAEQEALSVCGADYNNCAVLKYPSGNNVSLCNSGAGATSPAEVQSSSHIADFPFPMMTQ